MTGNEEYIAGVEQMNEWELLTEVIESPEHLSDSYYSVFGDALRKRYETLKLLNK